MASAVADLANAVASFINDGPFTVPATVAYLPTHGLEEMAAPQITVMPRSMSVEKLDRATEAYDVQIDVALQQRVNDEQSAPEVEGLLGLVEQLADYLKFEALPAMPGAMFIGIANEPIYSQDHLREHHVFTAVVTLTYRIRR